MAGSFQTTCPGCGGPAHTNDDDGVTYCDNHGPNGCLERARSEGKSDVGAGMHCEYDYFQPANRRGGT